MKKLNVIALHLAYWVVYVLFLSLMMVLITRAAGPFSTVDLDMITLLFYIMGISAGVVGFYGAYTVVFDRFLKHKRILMTVAAALLAAFVGALAADLGLTLVKGRMALFAGGMQSCIEITLTLTVLVGLPNVLLGLGMRAFISWYEDIQTKKALAEQNHAMEMALIKAQINPHFLFNTIANIDVLIAKDPNKASEYLHKLSAIMRFMLYETQAEAIPLSKEIDYIAQYVALQKIRFSSPEKVKFEIEGKAADQQIAPMLFIPFIENAFKFGESKKSDAMIAVHFRISAKEISFECKNAFQPSSQNGDASGLGNALIAKRIALLYPGRHQLTTAQENGIYTVKLIISLP